MPDGPFECGCGKRYTTADNLRHHQKYYCRPADESDNVCKICGRAFRNYQGVRLHMSKKHTEEYNNDLEKADNRRIRPWAALEKLDLARAEIAYEGININKHLATLFPERSIDQIKSFRRGEDYKALRDRLKIEMEEAVEDVEADEPSDVSRRLSSTLVDLESSTLSTGPLTFEAGPPDSPNSPTVSVENVSPIMTQLQDIPDSPPSPTPHSPIPQVPEPLDAVLEFIKTVVARIAPDHNRMELLNGIIESTFSAAETQNALNKIWEWIIPNRELARNTNNNNRTYNNQLQLNNRRQKYAYLQRLYKKDRSRLAEGLLNDTIYTNQAPTFTADDAFRAYSDILGSLSNADNNPVSDFVTHDIEIYAPILDAELRQFLNLKQSNAKGPDNIRISDLKAAPFNYLLLLVNIILYTSVIPDNWRVNRTVLIPKPGSDNADVTTWRPLTISSAGLRLFNKILAARFAKLPLATEQRGFRSIDGTFANNISLQCVIKQCRADHKPFSISTLDLRKAFDTVSHHSIGRAMLRFGLHQKIKNLILDNYTGCSTRINVNGTETEPIPINRGVKQGDPLSPILFNMVMDEAITTLKNTGAGLAAGDGRLMCLAYADDIVLFTESKLEMQLAIRVLEKQMVKRGMSFNPDKCTNLTCPLLPGRAKLYVATRPYIVVNGALIGQLSVADQFKYLGYQYGFMGARVSSLDELPLHLDRVATAPLKPQQKLDIIKTYLIPRYIYLLQNPGITLRTLSSVDRQVRLSIKRILHLPKQLSNAALYAPVRQGGLGILSFRCRVPGIMLDRLGKLNEHVEFDRYLAHILSCDFVVGLRDKLTTWCGATGTSAAQVASYWSSRLESSASGGGLWQIGSEGGCRGLVDHPPAYWNGEEFVKALQLRFNVLPTKGGLHNRTRDVLCRAGCGRRETVCHVLQACPVTHRGRVVRHDRVVNKIADFAAQRNIVVVKEPRIRDSQGALHKPDLLLRKDNQLYVTDIAIHWEGPDILNTSARHKIARYSGLPFLEALSVAYPDCNVQIMPFVLGARGGWSTLNNAVCSFVGMNNSQKRMLVSSVLKGGWLMHSTFSTMVYADQRR